MDPDAIIQPTLSKKKKLEAVTNSDSHEITSNSKDKIRLIGNCVALQNGIKPQSDSGIKQGSLVVSCLNFENLSAGEVKMACQINGFGEAVYVGVKFRKQLSLGSADIDIVYVEGGKGHCDLSKGRKSLFIPHDHVGKGKTFQVQ